MAVSVPTQFPLTSTSLASEVVEFSPIEAVPEGRHLLRAATWAYASGCRRQVFGLDANYNVSGSLVTTAPSGGAREVVSNGTGRLSPHGRRLAWSVLCDDFDGAFEVYGLYTGTPLLAAVTFGGASASPTEYTGTLDLTGAGLPAGAVSVLVVVYGKQAGGSPGRMFEMVVLEAVMDAADLP